jgi:hypothetical protein
MKPTFPERLSTATPVFREVPAASLGGVGVTAPTSSEFNLPRGALWSTGPRRDLAVHCIAGQLWITQAGDGRDTVLRTGETFTPASKGRVVIQALTDSRIQLA